MGSSSYAPRVYAAAMVKLNDAGRGGAQIAVNLAALGQVATATAVDAETGATSLTQILSAQAVTAVDPLLASLPATRAGEEPRDRLSPGSHDRARAAGIR